MASNDKPPLQFHGKDAQECNAFIASMINYAFERGKSRDDGWMADFAATRMDGDALRWWSALDDEVQGSWKSLRRAIFVRFRPMFYGTSGEEAEQFVQAVRHMAEDAGRQQDNDWIVNLVSSSLGGKALRWHISLDAGTKGDWEKLQVAIMTQYPNEDDSRTIIRSTIPTPAPAAPGPPLKTKQRARIRVSTVAGSEMQFLSRNADNCGLTLSASESHSLVVEYDVDCTSPMEMRIPDKQIPSFDRLVLRMNVQRNPGHAYIYAMNPGDKSFSDGCVCKGATLANPWVVSASSTRGSLLSLTAVDQPGINLIPLSSSFMKYIWFRPKLLTSDVAVELFLEPI